MATDREERVFMAKLAEQAERYEGSFLFLLLLFVWLLIWFVSTVMLCF